MYEPGTTTVDDGVIVRRFPVVGSKPRRSRERIESRIQSGAAVPLADQLAWLDGLFRVPDLFHHLVVSSDQYDAVILSPYLFWTTVTGATIVPDRTIVMPCLHDEPYARLEVLHPVLSDVARLWFLSEPEHELAHEIATLPDHVVTGAGVHVPTSYDPEGFCARHNLSRPFILFAGRRERGKGWDWLLAAFHFAIRQYDLPFDLVTIGVSPAASGSRPLGPRARPRISRRIRSRRRLRGRNRLRAAEHQRELLAHDHGVVAGRHAGALARREARCCAGTAIDPAAASPSPTSSSSRNASRSSRPRPSEAAQLAKAGREYVLANYQWDVVLDAMETSVEDLRCESS